MTTLYINPAVQKGHINPELQGQFSEHLGRCIYEGLYVGEKSKIPNVKGMRKDVVDALKKIHVPVLRWPGGCFADEYHWKDGIGPKSTRKRMVNTHWGGVVEDNSFGTHEFMELCKQIGCKTYINGNVGSGTVQEMSEWYEYMTFEGESPMSKLREKNGHKAGWNVDYFGVGNESWGCGGNMRPVYYADLYRRYQTYVRDYRHDGHTRKIACGPNAGDFNWTKQLLATCYEGTPASAHGFMDGLSLHYYTLPGDWVGGKGSATKFDTAEYYHTVKKTLFMEELIKGHGAIMDQYDPDKKIGLIIDEWGTWYDVEPGTNPGFLYQQNTMRDAIIAGINLNLFNKHCDRVKMANIAQMVNVLQAMILTDGDKMILTPTYHVFDLYQKHQDAELVESVLVDNDQVGVGEDMVPRISESVSRMKDGKLLITLVNLSADEEAPLTISLSGEKAGKAEGRVLAGKMDQKNTFKSKTAVKPAKLTGLTVKGDQIKVTLPACSVAEIVVTQ